MAWEGSAGVEKTFSIRRRPRGVDPDTVGEGAAGVDGYAEGLGAAGHGL